MPKKDLVEIIKANPGCVAEINNDCWSLRKGVDPPSDYDNWTDDAQDDWWRSIELANSDEDLVRRGHGRGSGNLYGGDILQALAEIVGIRVESV